MARRRAPLAPKPVPPKKAVKDGLLARVPPWVDVLAIFSVALAVRLLYQRQIGEFPYLNVPLVDAEEYLRWARQLAGGDWLGKDIFYQAPGYPYFLGLVIYFLNDRMATIQAVQHLLGALTCLLLYAAAYNIFGRTTAILAGLGGAFYGILVCFEGFAIKSALELFLLGSFIAVLSLQSKKSSYGLALAAGFIAGLMALVRENLALLAVFAGVFLFFSGTAPPRKRLIPVLFLFVGLASALAPVAIRNYVVGKDLVLITSQGGTSLYLGNNPQADGGYQPLIPGYANPANEGRYARVLAEKDMGRPLKPSEISRYWTRKAVAFILEEPRKAAWLYIMKFRLFWHEYEIPDSESYYWYRQFSPLLRWLPVNFGIVAVLGLTGIVFTLKDGKARLLHLLVLGMLLGTLPFFLFARYRLPVVVPLLILAAHCCTRFTARLSRRCWKSAARMGAAAMLSALLVYSMPGNVPKAELIAQEISSSYYNVGATFDAGGQEVEAVDFFRRAIASESRYKPEIDARTALAGKALARGNYDVAEAFARQALQIQPRYSKAWLVLGLVCEAQKKRSEAEAAYRRCLEIEPGNEEAIRALKRLNIQ